MMKDSQLQSISLKTLNLINFATFKQQSINFDGGFNAVVGETGSGKSLILDALQIILGSRADKSLVRKGADSAVIEACFQINNESHHYFESIGFPIVDDELIIKRAISSTGKSKAFINFQQCNLSDLISIAKHFVDLVGQFENQKLLSSNYQLDLLDHYSKNELVRKKYQDHYYSLKHLKSEIEALEETQLEKNTKLDYINFQLTELASADLRENSEDELIKQKETLSGQSKRKDLLIEVQNILSGETYQQGVLDQLQSCNKLLNGSDMLQNINSSALSDAIEAISDFSFLIGKEVSKSEEDNSEQLASIIDELDKIQKLKRKFKCDTKELIKIKEDFEKQKAEILNIEKNLEELKEQYELELKICQQHAKKLHSIRKKFAKELSLKLTQTIQGLNMKGASVELKIKQLQELNEKGHDELAFIVETNPGEGFYPLKKIASGGELSRVLLAIRKILSSNDSISIFLFDEIDAGIGGETALKIGQCLNEVSQSSQVIAITHLPQIASFAQKLVWVSKQTSSNRTWSSIRDISGPKIKKEVESMVPLQ